MTFKMRIGFVSNSSSCSFIINNKTKDTLRVSDFVKENSYLICDFNREYDNDYTLEAALLGCDDNYPDLSPGRNEVIFGDESGDVLGQIFDYILRDGGESHRFSWEFKESLR